MKILALGATGAIGQQLATLLAAQGHEIVVTSRRTRKVAGRITYRIGDAQSDAFLDTLLEERWDAIVDFMVYNTHVFSRRTDRLLNATAQYVLISSARVFAATEGLLRESSPRLLDVCKDAEYLQTDEYALTKARQEDLLRRTGRNNWTIVRPYITFGEERLQLGVFEKEAWLYRALHGRSIVFCDAIIDRDTTMTDGADVAGMISALVGQVGALGEDFNLTNGIALKWVRVLETYLRVLAAKRGTETQVVLQDLETFCLATRSIAQVLHDRVHDRRFDVAKIGQFFDMSQIADPLPALASRLEAQIDREAEFTVLDWRNEALRDKAARERAQLLEIIGFRKKISYLAHRYIPLSTIERLRRT